MRKLENEEIREWENEVKATREAPEERINFGKVYTPKSDTPELSERNEEVRKKGGGDFGEKRL